MIEHTDEIEIAKQDLDSLDEHDFEQRYKATKRQYKAVLKSIEWLNEAVYVLGIPGPMDIDLDTIDDAKCTIEDLGRLLERMHMAAYWKSEEQ
jgi:hypothetical protein